MLQWYISRYLSRDTQTNNLRPPLRCLTPPPSRAQNSPNKADHRPPPLYSFWSRKETSRFEKIIFLEQTDDSALRTSANVWAM